MALTKPRQESVAAQQLARQDFEVYLPLFRVFRRRAGGVVDEPMFPRYLFFRPRRASQASRPAQYSRGISGVVRFGIEYAVASDDVIAGLRALESARGSLSDEQIRAFKPGQVVQIVEGPLAGLTGLVHSVASKRVEVLIQLLGRPSRVALPPSAVDPFDGAVTPLPAADLVG